MAGAAERTLARLAAERARAAWQAGNLAQAARLTRQCMDLDPSQAPKWQARAEQIRVAGDKAELAVTLLVRQALAGIEPDDPALTRIAAHNRGRGIPAEPAAVTADLTDRARIPGRRITTPADPEPEAAR